jgi:FlaA1/EpsC-like NDP-sugar epimerase
MIGADAVMVPITLRIALALQFDDMVALAPYRELLLCAVICGFALFSALGLYRTIVRFMSVRAIGRVALAIW